jgi:hypothetical protein
MHPRALPGGGRGADDLLHVPGLDVLAGHVADDRYSEPLISKLAGALAAVRIRRIRGV